MHRCIAERGLASAPRAGEAHQVVTRPLTTLFPDHNGDQAWTYHPDGQVKDITTYNDAGTTAVVNAYTYNRRRLLTGEAMHQTGYTATWSLGYGYDRNGNQSVSLTQPGGEVLQFLPNALGQPTQVASTLGTYATAITWHPNGALGQFTYGNGLVHTLTQNARGLPERSRDAYSTTAVLDDTYDYDPNANVLAITDAATGRNQRGNRTMAYDGLDRLTKVVSPMFANATDSEARYGYDVLDNLVTVHVRDRHHFYCHDASNRLTNIKTSYCDSGPTVIGLGYDVQGNLANKNGQEFRFDYGNRLRSAVGVETYRYDGHGRRVLATSETGQGAIRSLYGHDGVLRYQWDDRQQKVFNHIYLAGSLIATRETPYNASVNTIKYQHTDALGSPVAVTDSNRTVIERFEYEPYGKVINPASPKDGPGYTGHVYDAVTGLNYMQQRYYDPLIGKFLSRDPVTADTNTGANFNGYSYANGNPYKFTDPDGRYPRGSVGRVIVIQMAGRSMPKALERTAQRALPSPARAPGELRSKLPQEMIDSAFWDLFPRNADSKEHGTVGYSSASEAMPSVSQGEITWSVGAGAKYLTHTHGNGDNWYENYFSYEDTQAAALTDLPVFLSNGRGEFRVFLPGMQTAGKIDSGPDRGRRLMRGQSEGILLCSKCMPTEKQK